MPPKRKKAQDAGGGKKKKAKQPQPTVARWLAPPVDTFGWETEIPQDLRIHKSQAMSHYQLEHDHLKDLAYDNEPRDDNKGYVHMYIERQVEWVAWQVYGGPDGLWNMLRQRRDEHVQSGSSKPFPCPYSYTQGRRFHLDLASPPSCDRYLMGHTVMISAKAELPAWFWVECNLALNRALSKGELPSGTRESATTERVRGMRAAVQFFRQHNTRYAGHPPDPIATGKSIWLPTLRAKLKEAPTISANLRDTDAWGPDKAGLVFHAGNYDWGKVYLESVFRQLCELVKEFGLGDNGWKSLRWEVYHRYATSVDGGLRYDARSRFWTDHAGIWLEGRIVPQPAPNSMRGRCADGCRYNMLLPVMTSTHRTPSPGPAPTSPIAPSPVRAPVAGPSSA